MPILRSAREAQGRGAFGCLKHGRQRGAAVTVTVIGFCMGLQAFGTVTFVSNVWRSELGHFSFGGEHGTFVKMIPSVSCCCYRHCCCSSSSHVCVNLSGLHHQIHHDDEEEEKRKRKRKKKASKKSMTSWCDDDEPNRPLISSRRLVVTLRIFLCLIPASCTV